MELYKENSPKQLKTYITFKVTFEVAFKGTFEVNNFEQMSKHQKKKLA